MKGDYMNILKGLILFLTLAELICRLEGTSLAQSAPIVTFSTPTNGTRELAAGCFSLNVAVTAAPGIAVTQLDYYVNSNILGVSTSSLHSMGIYYFSTNWANVPEGTYTLTAKAWDSQSLSGTSVPVTVVVVPGVLAGDVDGDRMADPGLYLTYNWQDIWYYWFSSLGYQRIGPCSFGFENYALRTPLLADFDGDRKADPIIHYPYSQWQDYWSIWLSSANYTQTNFVWGAPPSGTPLIADFDGDHKADPTVLHNGLWNIRLSGSGYSLYGPAYFNIPDGTPVAADFDGDGKADPAVVVSSVWYVALSSYAYSPCFVTFPVSDGIPLAADFDGDGLADPGVYQVGGLWYIKLSSAGYVLVVSMLSAP
jgi:hypothetical protein